MLKHLDRPLLAGRTARELLLISGGLCVSASEIWHRGLSGNAIVYLVITASLVLRLYAARALLVGLVVGAMAQVLPTALLHDGLADLVRTDLGLVLTWGGALLLLCSRDLEQRFDRAPSRFAWLPNFWTDIPQRDLRLLRICGYALGGLVAALVQTYCSSPFKPAWLLALIVAASLIGLLLVLGRSVAVLLASVLASAVAVGLLTRVDLDAPRTLLGAVNEVYGTTLSGHHFGEPDLTAFGWSPQFVLPCILFAAVAAIIALPYAIRLVRRVLAD